MVLPLALREVIVESYTPSLCSMRSRCVKTGVANEALTTLNSLAGFRGHSAEPVNQAQQEVRALLGGDVAVAPRADAASPAEAAFSALLRGMSV